MPAKCKTCPFRKGGFNELAPLVAHRCLIEASQICHHHVLSGKRERHLCRGARDLQLRVFYRLGVLAAPTDDAWAKAKAAIEATAV